MIPRQILTELNTLLREYPVVTILGPRQAGKTTLARAFLKGYQYSNLENPETRQKALDDPKGYLAQFGSKVIIDEIQRAPTLLSYIQTIVDEQKAKGRFVLTGSHQLKLHEAISQSLAGRTAILTLLPLSIEELEKAKLGKKNFEDYCFHGFLPRVYDESIRPGPVYSNYYQTYVERDVRQLIEVKSLSLFEKFLKLMAGRVGSPIDYSSLANDVGVSGKTISNWISILEASFILFRLPPFFENFGKRIIKSPKFYFIDVGLMVFLLGIEKKEQILRDPLVGSIFENLVVIECLKKRYNQGKVSNLYYYRDSSQNEVDLVFERDRKLVAVEMKSSSTYHSAQLKGIRKLAKLTDRLAESFLIYTGDDYRFSNGTRLLNFKDAGTLF